MKEIDKIIISDVRCADCEGEVTLFAVPDKVWKGLGLGKEWICDSCVAHRLNPSITVEELSEEIYKQRHRFNLEKWNHYCGAKIPYTSVAYASAASPAVARVTAAQAMQRWDPLR